MIQVRYPPQTSFFEIFHAKTSLRYSRRKQDGWSGFANPCQKGAASSFNPTLWETRHRPSWHRLVSDFLIREKVAK